MKTPQEKIAELQCELLALAAASDQMNTCEFYAAAQVLDEKIHTLSLELGEPAIRVFSF